MNTRTHRLPLCWTLMIWLAAASALPAAECETCGVSLAIPENELWQGVRKGETTIFAMQRGDELFATVEMVRIYNEARGSLDFFAEHYQDYSRADIVIKDRFVSRTINGIPVCWGRGSGRAEDGSEFLVHMLFFTIDPSYTCQLMTVVRKQSKDLHEYLMPEIIQSLRWLDKKTEQ